MFHEPFSLVFLISHPIVCLISLHILYGFDLIDKEELYDYMFFDLIDKEELLII